MCRAEAQSRERPLLSAEETGLNSGRWADERGAPAQTDRGPQSRPESTGRTARGEPPEGVRGRPQRPRRLETGLPRAGRGCNRQLTAPTELNLLRLSQPNTLTDFFFPPVLVELHFESDYFPVRTILCPRCLLLRENTPSWPFPSGHPSFQKEAQRATASRTTRASGSWTPAGMVLKLS